MSNRLISAVALFPASHFLSKYRQPRLERNHANGRLDILTRLAICESTPEVGEFPQRRELGGAGTVRAVMFRHGLWASEACSLRWTDIDLERGIVYVHRIKNRDPSVHPLAGRELPSD
jgi:integrase